MASTTGAAQTSGRRARAASRVGGASLACSILWVGYSYLMNFVKHALPFLPFVEDRMMLVHLNIILVTFGVFLGTMGSLLAVGRFLIEA